MRKFGPQPIREIVWRRGYTHNEFADLLAIHPGTHVRSALQGFVPPNEELRRLAPAFLNVPLEDLFTAESLAAVCRPLPPGLRRKSAVTR